MRADPNLSRPEVRLRLPWIIASGIIAGGLALASAVGVAASFVPATAQSLAVFLLAAVLLLSGDVWAIGHARLYPFSLRRQASQRLVLRWRRTARVLFTWGFDAGFSLGTYRVTSGLWLLILATLTGLSSFLALFLSTVAFAGGLLICASWLRRGPSLELRLQQLGAGRRHAQFLYLVVAIVWLATIEADLGF